MSGLNKETLIGNPGKDPEVQVLEGNVPVAKFPLATSETYRDKGGQPYRVRPHTSTDWHSVVLWRGLAELAQAYLRRGSLVYLEGKLKTRHYDDAAGQRHHVTEIIGEQVLMLDKKTGEVPPLAL
ncbi:MAG: single-stranded DNA-binding protein [Bacteroidota bacterium]|nr:single-stranded DNA-binding protein [Bacteroidota bacterium]